MASPLPAHTVVVHPAFLLRQPALDAPALAFLPSGMHLRVDGRKAGFLHVQSDDGRTGFVAAALCESWALDPFAVRVVQQVALYGQPQPGTQTEGIYFPHEWLLVLGRDDRFLLVQRENGHIGYVPAIVCGQSLGSRMHLGPIDLESMALGGGWAFVNLIGLVSIVNLTAWLEPSLPPYIMLGLLIAAVLALWFFGRHPPIARSFAIGAVLCYLFLHLTSNGFLTLWRS